MFRMLLEPESLFPDNGVNKFLHHYQLDGSTHPCKTEQCGGGVGRNIAEALWRLRDGRVRLLTAIGDDADGKYIENIAPGLILNGKSNFPISSLS
ncbi:jg10832 [Pararge aegeria aegeria]|uniref:Jg10832 protein n=1 Tax=Pararge aegeria aegeria TaxID=348720 RepID=A0A8S4SFW5_9NEOP|nr:jg10832 [Pararge aegeria aegeria]